MNPVKNMPKKLLVSQMENDLLKDFQQSWAKHKYWVMARNQNAYNEIRLLAKNNQWDVMKQAQYQKLLTELETVEPTGKTLRVTYQHIWGYFKKQATSDEKEKYALLTEDITPDSHDLDHFFQHLITKYQQPYLLQMRWIKD